LLLLLFRLGLFRLPVALDFLQCRLLPSLQGVNLALLDQLGIAPFPPPAVKMLPPARGIDVRTEIAAGPVATTRLCGEV
jgi:hypothetical protein